MNEIWKDIEGYEGYYQVSNLGRVKSLKRKVWNGKTLANKKESIMAVSKNKNNYLKVCLFKNNKSNTFYIHRLVAKAFIPNLNNLPQVNHKDEDKANNNAKNLEWCTQKYNSNYGTATERRIKNTNFKEIGRKMDKTHITNLGKKRTRPVINITTNISYRSAAEAAMKLDLQATKITACCKGKRKSTGGYKWRYSVELSF